MFVATIATGSKALSDVQVLLRTLEIWHPHAQVFVRTDSATAIPLRELKMALTIHVQPALDAYAGLTRSDMEAQSGRQFPTLWHEFMTEKLGVIRWASTFDTAGEGVWFLDADITLLAPLPTQLVEPSHLRVGLSPHMIRPADEAKFGRYNGGFVWMRDMTLLDVWRRATYSSRFYEQAALEHVASTVVAEDRVEFPIQDNFGWWRFFQSTDAPPIMQKRQGFHRGPECAGITFDGKPMRSLHTHWYETTDFNTWMLNTLKRLAKSHRPAKRVLDAVQKSKS